MAICIFLTLAKYKQRFSQIYNGNATTVVFQKRLNSWAFHSQPSVRFVENVLRKRKCPVSGRCWAENALFMTDVINNVFSSETLEVSERQTTEREVYKVMYV